MLARYKSFKVPNWLFLDVRMARHWRKQRLLPPFLKTAWLGRFLKERTLGRKENTVGNSKPMNNVKWRNTNCSWRGVCVCVHAYIHMHPWGARRKRKHRSIALQSHSSLHAGRVQCPVNWVLPCGIKGQFNSPWKSGLHLIPRLYCQYLVLGSSSLIPRCDALEIGSSNVDLLRASSLLL